MIKHIALRIEQGTIDEDDWYKLGEAYLAYGFFAEASECLQNSVNLNAGVFESQFLLASSESKSGKLQSAISSFSNARNCAKDEANRQCCDYEIAKMHMRLENGAEAESSLVKAGNHPLALYELAKMRARTNRSSEAMGVLNKLNDQHPFAIEYLLLKARVLEALGKSTEASRLYDIAEYNSRQLPESPLIHRIESVRESMGLQKKVKDAQGFLKRNRFEQATNILNEVNSAGLGSTGDTVDSYCRAQTI